MIASPITAKSDLITSARAMSRSLPKGFGAELKQAAQAASNPCTDLKTLRAQLSPSAQRVLDQIRSGTGNLSLSDWNSLCRELERLGALSSQETQLADPNTNAFHSIPVGNPLQIVVITPAMQPFFWTPERLMMMRLSGQDVGDAYSAWQGDPLRYLRDWKAAAQEWIDELLKVRAEDGTPFYQREDLAPIQERIQSCQKVYDLIKNLSQA